MSTYATIQGEIQYSNLDEFHQLIAELEAGGFLKDGHFLDEMGNPCTEFHNVENNERMRLGLIQVPLFLYKNLGAVNFFTPSAKGWQVGTTTDSGFGGWVIRDGKQENYDLSEWAEKENLAMPIQSDFASEREWYEAMAEWFQEVEQEFHEEFGG